MEFQDGREDDANNMQHLKELLLQQSRRSEYLGQEAAARDWERWELLQQLRQRDEQLEYEETAAAKQRMVLNSVRAGARHYRAVCCLRAWRSHVQQLCAERALLRAKNRLTIGRSRHAGTLLRAVLKHSVERQLTFGLNALWLNSASRALPQPLHPESPSSSQRHFDESGFQTPRKEPGSSSSSVAFRPSPVWDESPALPRSLRRIKEGSERKLNNSIRSEAVTDTTRAPTLRQSAGVRSSASSVSAFAESSSGTQLPLQPALAAARLAMTLQPSIARQLFWTLGRWSRVNHDKAESGGTQSPESLRLQSLELEGYQLRCDALEQRSLDEAHWRSEAELSMKVLRESLDREEQLCELLRARLWAVEQDSKDMLKEAEAERRLTMEGEERFHHQLATLSAERAELATSLQSAEAAQEVAAEQAANKVRRALLEAWGRDRGKWAEERAQLGAAATKAGEEAELARHASARAEAESLAKVRQVTAEAKEEARAELRGEEQLCMQLAAELRRRIAQAESLEAGLELRLDTQRKADSPWPGSPESVPMPSHLQLQELDAYAELVEQLRSEVAMERAEREVSARNLAALRDSYRLLLLRSSRDCSNQTPVKASMTAVPTAVTSIVH